MTRSDWPNLTGAPKPGYRIRFSTRIVWSRREHSLSGLIRRSSMILWTSLRYRHGLRNSKNDTRTSMSSLVLIDWTISRDWPTSWKDMIGSLMTIRKWRIRFCWFKWRSQAVKMSRSTRIWRRSLAQLLGRLTGSTVGHPRFLTTTKSDTKQQHPMVPPSYTCTAQFHLKN